MKKILCFILLYSMVYAQDKTKDDEIISEQEAFLQDMQANSEVEESPDNNWVSPQQKFEENPKYNVHEYNYKQQVVVGGAVMFCVALSLIVNNNYNPKRGK